MISFNRIHRTVNNLSTIYHLSFDVAWSLGLIIARGQFISGHVFQAKKCDVHKNPQK